MRNQDDNDNAFMKFFFLLLFFHLSFVCVFVCFFFPPPLVRFFTYALFLIHCILAFSFGLVSMSTFFLICSILAFFFFFTCLSINVLHHLFHLSLLLFHLFLLVHIFLFFCFLFFVQGFFPWLVPFFCISFESSFLVILLFSTTFH